MPFESISGNLVRMNGSKVQVSFDHKSYFDVEFQSIQPDYPTKDGMYFKCRYDGNEYLSVDGIYWYEEPKLPFNDLVPSGHRVMINNTLLGFDRNTLVLNDRILVPIHLWNDITPNNKCFVVLPEVVTDAAAIQKKLSAIDASYGVYASGAGMLSLAKEKGHKVYADWGMNIYNSVSALFLSEIAESVTLSPELSLSAIKDISAASEIPTEIVAYGYYRKMRLYFPCFS